MELTEKEIEIARDAKNKYMREYRKRNKKKFDDYNVRYWMRKAIEMGIVDADDVEIEV